MKSFNVIVLLRFIATLLTFIILFSICDSRDVVSRIAAIGLLPFAAALILLALCTAGMAWKWQLALPGGRFTVLLRALVSAYFYSILPSGQLGGEVSKVFAVKSRQPELRHIMSSLVFDKITGLLGLVIIGGVALVFSTATHDWQWVILISIATPCLVALWGSGHLVPLIERMSLKHSLSMRLRGVLSDILNKLKLYTGDSGLLARSLALGIVTQGAVVAIYMVISVALGISIVTVDLVSAVVLANLAALIPISIAGLGVREAGLTVLLSQSTSIAPGEALSLALSAMGVLLVGALAGALVELHSLATTKPSY